MRSYNVRLGCGTRVISAKLQSNWAINVVFCFSYMQLALLHVMIKLHNSFDETCRGSIRYGVVAIKEEWKCFQIQR